MSSRSLKVNFAFYLTKQLMSILFPLITFTYAARTLGVDGIGAVNYTKSVITYFTMISTFGVTNYAIREGARIRDNKEKINQFATEMFLINIISTSVACVFGLIVVFLPSFSQYRHLLCVFYIMIPFTLIGVEWVYSIYEDYKYITMRAIAFQCLSLLLLFILVKSERDRVQYALITVISTVGSNVFNFIHSRVYVCFFRSKSGYRIRKHFKAISIVFLTTLASQIYLNMDISMVGFIAGDRASGLYSASHKLIVTLTTLISSLRIVLLPRLSYYLGVDSTEKRFERLNQKSIKALLCICIPLMVGLFCLSPEAIILFCGMDYSPASLTLRILIFGMLFSTMNGFIVYQLLMPKKLESVAFRGTLIGAIVNLILNSVLIPRYAENGAALGTVIAEIAVFIYCFIKSKEMLNYRTVFLVIGRYLLLSLPIILICYLFGIIIPSLIVKVVISVLCSTIVYGILLSLSHDELIHSLFRVIMIRIKRKQ